ncbi:uncharacterized protein LOC129946411 [Eupeodes corollae]|uniref:uncharacterized protein LOC129946411 n=1 Tax=Eupeodes corollae TaxID=290404 RepID=UPI00249229E0|nr:uncharacterized protein LOC129946411 [Eupeodes corollae]
MKTDHCSPNSSINSIMAYLIKVLILLISIVYLNEAQQFEIPSDLLLPCQSYDYGYSSLPVEEAPNYDARPKRQQKMSLGYKIESLKRVCANQMGIPLSEIPQDLLYEENPTPKIKCVMACVLQRLQLMTKNNLISTRGIEKLADEVGNSNPLITAIAVALAERFNERLSSMNINNPCEAGFRINQYIAEEMRARKIDVPY